MSPWDANRLRGAGTAEPPEPAVANCIPREWPGKEPSPPRLTSGGGSMESGDCQILEGSSGWGPPGHPHYVELAALVGLDRGVTIPMPVCLARLRMQAEPHPRAP